MDDDFCISQNQDTCEVESISTPTTGKFMGRIASYLIGYRYTVKVIFTFFQ